MVSPKEIRAARAWLQRRGIPAREVSPKRFASAAKELDKGFRELLQYLARLQMGGQGEKQQRQESIRKAAEGEAA